MLIFLLSKPDNWTVNVKHLISQSPKAKREKVEAILRELQDNGYITKGAQKKDPSGKFSYQERDVHEMKVTVAHKTVDGETVDGQTVDGKPTPIVSTELYQVLNVESTEDSNSCSDENSSEPVSKPFQREFNQLWEIYPRKVGRKKAYDAVVARLRAGVTFDDLLTATQNYASIRRNQDQQFTLHAGTFFGSSVRYEDYIAPTSDVTAQPRSAYSDIEAFLQNGFDE